MKIKTSLKRISQRLPYQQWTMHIKTDHEVRHQVPDLPSDCNNVLLSVYSFSYEPNHQIPMSWIVWELQSVNIIYSEGRRRISLPFIYTCIGVNIWASVAIIQRVSDYVTPAPPPPPPMKYVRHSFIDISDHGLYIITLLLQLLIMLLKNRCVAMY